MSHGGRVKHYLIEAPAKGTQPAVERLVRGTSKVAQRILREFHRAGVKATLRCLTNKAELNRHLAVA